MAETSTIGVGAVPKLAELDTAERADLFALWFEHPPCGAAVASADGQLLIVNRALAKMLDRDAADLIGCSLSELCSDGGAEVVTLLQSLHDGASRVMPVRLQLENGQLLVVLEAIALGVDGAELICLFVHQSRDLAEPDPFGEIDRARRESAVLSTLIAQSDDAIILSTLEGVVTEWNAAAERIFGYSAAEMVGQSLRILVPEERVGEFDAAIAHVRSGQPVRAMETERACKDGRSVTVSITATPLVDAAGRVFAISAFVRDVSEQKQAQEALRRSRRLLAKVIEVLPVGVWIADRAGRIFLGNPASKRIWGGTRFVGIEQYGEYKGWWADTGKPIASEEWALARAVRHGETSLGEIVNIECFDGTKKKILNSSVPLLGDDGEIEGAIGVNEDITALTETEQALRLEVAAREQILRIVSHDLKNPLNAILLNCEMAKEILESAPFTESLCEALLAMLDRVARQAYFMDRLIEDLLDFTRIDQGRLSFDMTLQSPAQLVLEAVERFQVQAAQSSLTLASEIEADLSPIVADHDRMLQVLSNLIANAIKFTPEQGNVTVRVSSHADGVVFSVADTGSGIRAQDLTKLFAPFWQANTAERRGLGLGLAISKAIVEAHRGRIWAECEPGSGATLRFSVPSASRPTDR